MSGTKFDNETPAQSVPPEAIAAEDQHADQAVVVHVYRDPSALAVLAQPADQRPACTCTPEVGGRMRCLVCGGWPARVLQREAWIAAWVCDCACHLPGSTEMHFMPCCCGDGRRTACRRHCSHTGPCEPLD